MPEQSPHPTIADHDVEHAIDVLVADRASNGRSVVHVDRGLDALSMLGAAAEQPMRPASPLVERDLDLPDATAVASGWLTWPIALTGRWWEHVTSPMLVDDDGAPGVVLPHGSGAVLVEAGSRRQRRLRVSTSQSVSARGLALAALPGGRWPKALRETLARQRGELVLLVVLALIGGLAGLVMPIVTSSIFSDAIPNGQFDIAVALIATLLIASIGAALVAWARGNLIVRIRDRMDASLMPGVLARTLRLTPPFFRVRSIADITSRVLALETARQSVSDVVMSTVLLSSFGLVSLAYIFTAGVAVGLTTLVAVGFVFVAVILMQWRTRSRLPLLLEARSRTNSEMQALLDSLIAWRVAGAESRAFLQWAREQSVSTHAMRARLQAMSMSAVIESAGPTIVIAAFIFAVVAWPSSSLNLGTSSASGAFIAVYTATLQVTLAMISLGSNALALTEYGPTLDRMQPILSEPVEGPTVGGHAGVLSGAVAINDVTFGYETGHAPLFERLSMSAAPGEFVAVVGPSGSGKSTLLRLLLGFETPWSGFVEYDRMDLTTLDVSSVRRQLGVVLQASQPLGRTIRECIIGSRDLSDARVWDLLDRVALADEVRRSPHQLDTRVGEQGSALSGGQRQRLMIATALAREPRIILFDEATSALDTASQSTVMDTVLSSRATRIVIAHRLSTIEQADRIVVIDGGRVREEGAPGELLRANGLFHRLASRQTL